MRRERFDGLGTLSVSNQWQQIKDRVYQVITFTIDTFELANRNEN